MNHILECEVCKKSFNMNNYEKCPSCKTPYIDPRMAKRESAPAPIEESTTSVKSSRTQPSAATSGSRASQQIDPLVAAQNRTTHAVRALAITFVAAPILLILVGGFIGIAVGTGNLALTVVALLVGLFSFGWILVSSLSELAKSKVH
jgi:hypothetical protein